MLDWDAPNERYYQHGVDRGVLYTTDHGAVAWNGLIGVDESGGNSSEILYRDGRIYLADVLPGDFQGSVSSYFFPDEFSKCIGIVETAEGLYIDNQKPKRFGLSYRSLIGSGTAGDMFGYQIHLVYNAIASIGDRSRKTNSDSAEPMEFTFPMVCTPIKLTGYRPSAHYILDTRHMDVSLVKQLEDLLYGTPTVPGRLPLPSELFDLMNFGTTITVTELVDETMNAGAAGIINTPMFSVAAARQYLTVHVDHDLQWWFEVQNINATDNGDGTYDMSDGGDTVVIVP